MLFKLENFSVWTIICSVEVPPESICLPPGGGDGGKNSMLAYDRCLHNMNHDPRWQKEVMLGRRTGLYRFRGELGQGNFSTVRLAFHQLTRGKISTEMIVSVKKKKKKKKKSLSGKPSLDMSGPMLFWMYFKKHLSLHLKHTFSEAKQ